MWFVRLMPALVLETMVGALLLGYGKAYVLPASIQGDVAALILVAMNTFLLCLWGEMDTLRGPHRAILIAGTLLGGCLACAGAALAQRAALWDALTLAGVLMNMEVAAAVVALAPRRSGARDTASEPALTPAPGAETPSA